MKQLTKSLFVLMLMLGTMLEMKAVSLLYGLQQMSNRVTISWAISSRHIIKVENIIQAATARR